MSKSVRKNPRRSFFGIPENPQVEKSRRCGPFGLEIGSQRPRQDNVISYFHSQLTGKSTPEQAPGSTQQCTIQFFRLPKVGGTPNLPKNWTIWVLKPIVTWGNPHFQTDPNVHALTIFIRMVEFWFSFHEPGNLQVEKLKSWNQESRTSFRYSI